MKITDPLHVAHWGTYVTTPEITAAQAKVAIETTIRHPEAAFGPEETGVRATDVYDQGVPPVD